MREKRKPNLFCLFLYRDDKIRKRFRYRFTCSIRMRLLPMAELYAFSSCVSLWFLLAFTGIRLLEWILAIPWYPLSAMTVVSDANGNRLSLNMVKSCSCPCAKNTHTISSVAPSTTTCALSVCFFFFPENAFRCFFLDVLSRTRSHQPKRCWEHRPHLERVWRVAQTNHSFPPMPAAK